MKTSNKLLIVLFAIGLFTLIGSNVALKAEHDKINFDDPFYGLSSVRLKPFRVLKLEGNNAGLIGVQTGKTAEIRLPERVQTDFTYRTLGDTLVVTYKPQDTPWQSRANQYFDAAPAAVILTPTLQTLMTSRISCALDQLDANQLAVVQQNAGVLIKNSTISNLTVTNTQGSELHTKPTNRIETALVTSLDSSAVLVERDVFGSFALRSDSLAMVKLPGSLLKKLKP
ncbi:hypothetical protein GCM10027299_46650 [Larkinella ripae]